MPDRTQRETSVGVIDIACVREAPSADPLGRASVHTTTCDVVQQVLRRGRRRPARDGTTSSQDAR